VALALPGHDDRRADSDSAPAGRRRRDSELEQPRLSEPEPLFGTATGSD
jgi:hypothetical protein